MKFGLSLYSKNISYKKMRNLLLVAVNIRLRSSGM